MKIAAVLINEMEIRRLRSQFVAYCDKAAMSKSLECGFTIKNKCLNSETWPCLSYWGYETEDNELPKLIGWDD
ncbi:hypothetical protein SMBr_11360 [Shewanella sp. M-Br]|nr:hypothetical protein SMBr_11360 [Shewanella sp. M-Br]